MLTVHDSRGDFYRCGKWTADVTWDRGRAHLDLSYDERHYRSVHVDELDTIFLPLDEDLAAIFKAAGLRIEQRTMT